jgi:hypothetical protein
VEQGIPKAGSLWNEFVSRETEGSAAAQKVFHVKQVTME